MKMTLLEMVQNILSALEGEEVTSITDTVESMQIAHEVRNAYYETFGNIEIKSRLELDSLEDFTDAEGWYLHTLKIPERVDNIKWMKYNHGTITAPEWKDVTYICPEEYLEKVMKNVDGTNFTEVKDFNSGLWYYVDKTKQPEYWTTFDNEYVVFDSFLQTVDPDIDFQKTMIYAEVIPTFVLADSTIPDLDDKFFPQLLAEAKSASFINYKGVSSNKEEQRARRQLVRHQNNRGRMNQETLTNTNYGRS